MKDASSKREVRMTEGPPDDPVVERIRRTVAKYEAKSMPERTTAILAAKSGLMRERYRAQAVMQGLVDKAVAEVTDAAGVPVMTRLWYKSFGREVSRIWRTMPTTCLEIEYDIVRYKWTARGLDPTLLVRVRVAVIELLEACHFPRKYEPLT